MLSIKFQFIQKCSLTPKRQKFGKVSALTYKENIIGPNKWKLHGQPKDLIVTFKQLLYCISPYLFS